MWLELPVYRLVVLMTFIGLFTEQPCIFWPGLAAICVMFIYSIIYTLVMTLFHAFATPEEIGEYSAKNDELREVFFQ